MRGFLGAVTGYPTVIFSFALIVVVGYWVLVLVGGAHLQGARGGSGGGHAGGHGAGHGAGQGAGQGAGHGAGHGAGQGAGHGGGPGGQVGGLGGQGHGAGHGHGHAGGRHGWAGLPQRVLGLGGVPITVAVSLVVVLAWFAALVGGVWAGGDRAGAGGRWFLLPVALVVGWAGTRLLIVPLRRMLPEPPPPPSRRDFVGLGCVIRTGRVGPDFGQAEVHAADGSSAVVQVRQSLDDAAGPGDVLRAGAAALIYDYDADGEFFWVMPAPPATG